MVKGVAMTEDVLAAAGRGKGHEVDFFFARKPQAE